MTLIASVIARDGISIIADSLVTTQELVLTKNEFIDFLKDKEDNPTISKDDLDGLFNYRDSYTRDYSEKLFQYGTFSAVTISGSAYINREPIGKLIKHKAELVRKDKKFEAKSTEEKVKDFCDYMQGLVIQHLNKFNRINFTIFLMSLYNKKEDVFQVYRILIIPSRKEDIQNPEHIFIKHEDVSSLKVICEGQNKLTNIILFGNLLYTSQTIITKVVNKVCESLQIDDKNKEKEISEKIDTKILYDEINEEMNIFKFRDLSIQEAVDLASLLMTLVIEIQKYMERIPTVGGDIKLATIDKNTGFVFHKGHSIIIPSYIKH